MSEKQSDSALEGRSSTGKLLLASLLLGGTALALAGILCWRSSPSKTADRLLERARRKVTEIESILGRWQSG